jgi:hypothetical protein
MAEAARAERAITAREETEIARAEQLAALDEQFLRCRELGHAWREIGAWVSFRKGGKAREITEAVTCDRCECERHDRLDARTYEVTGRTYYHAEGYLMEGAGYTLRSHVRAEKFTRHPASDIKPAGL